ncbi:MAG TPA: hypothetical protein VKA50_06680 [Gammaproteobacteria bacterium]|nr:hypothetical protein [Gammaproteobacteria bacterium]
MNHDATFELRQEDVLRRERRFELFNDRYVRVFQARKKQDVEYTIDLLALAPGSERKIHFHWKWLSGACLALTICAAVTFALFREPSGERMLYLAPILLIALAACLGMFYQFFATSQRCQVFSSRFAGVPLVELLVNRPDAARFKAFVQDLEIRIDLVSQKTHLTDNELKAGEMRMLRRLASRGVINDKAYNHAKSLILAQA